ncbi:Chromatin assembly factor-I [Phytophthora cinnamomi]|uniref:Chromatin assembly factor-I n=1 Tax=Phytophthora cinnamomi TaxID=4785 RepID=UPI00355A3412|nr:Chromatin assembly factor-I [Phytophthora cinnamomi]
MARGARGVTCRECGCLNFSSEHDVCDSCRSKPLAFRPTARRVAASALSAAANGASNSRRNEDSLAQSKKRRLEDSKNASNKRHAEDKPKPKPKPAPAKARAKTQPDVIDLISDDEEEDDVQVQKVVQQSLESHRQEQQGRSRREEEALRKQLQDEQRALFQSRVFPSTTFRESDFPSMEAGALMRKRAAERGVAQSQPTSAGAAQAKQRAHTSSASQPAPVVARDAKEKQVHPKPAEPRPPPAVVVDRKGAEKETQTQTQKAAEELRKRQALDARPDSTAGKRVQATVDANASLVVSKSKAVEEKTAEKEDPLFQSRVFEPVEFQAADFVTVFDGLAVARRSHPPTVHSAVAAGSNAATSMTVGSGAATAPSLFRDPSSLGKRAKRQSAKPGASRREAPGVCAACPAPPSLEPTASMVEQKKGPRQASISSFFSPKKVGENEAEAEPKSAAAKRPRVASPAAKSEAEAANSEEKTGKTEETPPKKKAAVAKPRAKTPAKARAKGKTKASPKPKPKPKKPAARFISPHAVVDDEDEDDLDDDEDVFSTPEAKRARAELETGGETVPAGAPISDDAIVNEEDIVDVSEEAGANAKGEDEGDEKEITEDVAAEESVVDLTAASTSADEGAAQSTTENGKGQGKAVKSPAARAKGTKAAKTPTKRQQKMKEKAAAAEVKAAPVEPLDPATQARVDTYKLKTDELTKQFMELLQSKQESDTVMQDIFGAALDINLDITVDQDKARQALSETWRKLHDQANSVSKTADEATTSSSVEFPHEVKCFMVKVLQGRTVSLSVVSGELLASFKKEVEADDVDMEVTTEDNGSTDTGAVDRATALAIEMEIKMLAQRTAHGVRPPKANVFEDTSADALWVWEVGNPEKYFVDDAQKTIKRMRKNRKRLGQQLKALAKVVQLLHQKPVDEAKVSAEEAKIGKFGFAVDAELQKAKDREMKEQEKLQAAEEKKRHGLERKQAKDEEKRKREREEEEKKAESSKRQKQFASFFVKSSSGLDSAAASGAGTSASAIDMTGDQDADSTSGVCESRRAKIDRMDAAFSFLGSSGDTSPGASNSGSHKSIFSSLNDRRGAPTNTAGTISPEGWSAQRFRDPKLGAMKLLQFYENVRPAYYGTYSTRSRVFRGGRRPLAQYAKFDYSVDSDDEWEEEEPGESLSDADDDADESDEDNLDYEDQWLAYEDEVDYMDDAPADDDERMDRAERPSSPTKHKLPSQLQKKRAKVKTVKPAKLEPQIVGPFWCNQSGTATCAEAHFPGLVGELLCDPVFESTLMRKAREYEEEQKRLEALRQEQQRKKELQQEEEKKKAEEKRAQEAKEKAAAVSTTDQVKPAGPVQPVKSAEKATVKTAKVAEKSKPSKAKSQKTAPPKAKTPTKQPAAVSASTTPAKSNLPAVATTPSPAKSVKPIDSFFKKMGGPVPVPPQQPQQSQQQDEQKTPKEGSVEVISVD